MVMIKSAACGCGEKGVFTLLIKHGKNVVGIVADDFRWRGFWCSPL